MTNIRYHRFSVKMEVSGLVLALANAQAKEAITKIKYCPLLFSMNL